jgi:hypothetical protein
MFRLSSKAKANPVFAVWIQPTPITGLRQISSHAFWSVKQSNEFLELLEHVTTPKQTSLFSDIVQSVRALNPLDANPHQFRLLLRVRGSGGPAFIVAESSRLDNILLHWEHLMRLLAQCGEHVLDAHDKVTFLVSKVARSSPSRTKAAAWRRSSRTTTCPSTPPSSSATRFRRSCSAASS